MQVVKPPRAPINPELRRDILGGLLVVLALLTAVALIAGQYAGVLDYWRRAVVTVFGWGATIVPALMLLWAWDLLIERRIRGRGASAHAMIGSTLVAVALLGLLHSVADDPLRWAETGRGGGYAGFVLHALFARLVGSFGAGLIFVALLIAGICLFLNNELRAFVAWLRTPAPPAPRAEPSRRPRPASPPPEFARPMRTRLARDFDAPDEYDAPPMPVLLRQPAPFSRPPGIPILPNAFSATPGPVMYMESAPPALPALPATVAATNAAITAPATAATAATDETDDDDDEIVSATPSSDVPATMHGIGVRRAISVQSGIAREATPRATIMRREPPKPAPEAAPPQPLPAPTPIAGRIPPPPPKPIAADVPRWTLPPMTHMERYPEATVRDDELEEKAAIIERTLASFRVEATVREINPGPAITQFALEPGVGVKVRRVTELHNDLALALAVPALRIEAPIPSKSRIGIEIPNAEISVVGLRDALESSDFTEARAKLPVPLGRDVNGRYQVADLARMPHLLVAGSTGSGKSGFTNAIISTLLLNRTPEEMRMVLVDPKMVEMNGYNGVPHLLAPVVTDMEKVVGILRWAVTEMERRYQLLMRTGVRNLDAYHKRCLDLAPALDKPMENLPYIVIIIDELADLMMTAPDDIETALVRLAQKARATGMHLILATQRPSVDVITGLIKANFPARVAFAVTSQIDSRVILDTPGAERLLGRGDMLYKAADSDKTQRIQGAWVSDADIEKIVGHWRLQAPDAQYEREVEEAQVQPKGVAKGGKDDAADGALIDRARAIVRDQGWASTSMLQSRLRIGYARAARLVEALEREGLIGAQDNARRQQLLDMPTDAANAEDLDATPSEGDDEPADALPRAADD